MPYHPLLHVVLFEPEIPYNAGSVGRSCVAVGAKLWMVRPLGFRVDSAQVRRAGLDYWQHLNWEVVNNWDHLLERLDPGRMWFFSARAKRRFTTVQFRPGDVLVFGPESTGLPQWLLQRYEQQVLRIPIRSQVRSLNLSVSVAVVLFHALSSWEQQGQAPAWFVTDPPSQETSSPKSE